MARLHRRLRRRKKRSSGEGSPRHNPPLLTDLFEFVGPGFAAFAATRFGTRIATTQIAKRKPTWGKHAGALASLGTVAALYFFGSRIKWLAKYHTPILVGSAIAAAQTLIQLYLPKFGWIVSDASPELAATQQQQQLAAARQAPPALPSNLEYVNEDPSQYTYNDAYDGGIYKNDTPTPTAQAPAGPATTSTSGMDDLGLDFEDEGEHQSIFAS